jgi:molybdate transport system substrate-binding protein
MPGFGRSLSLVALILVLVAMPFMAGSAAAEVACGEATPATTPATTTAATPASIPEATFPDEGGMLTILAAASLTDAFAGMERRLEEAHPGLDIVIETAGSQTLVTQLQQGAAADVLATADMRWMETAIGSGLIEGAPVAFTANRLVIVASPDNPAEISTIDDLTGDEVTLILAGADVPAGAYTRRAFCDYAGGQDAPEGFIGGVNANLASEEQDVRSVLAKVQLGEADAGVVYASDAAAAAQFGTGLTVIEFPEGVSTNATYPIAPVAGGNTDLANAFIAYVMGDEGQRILADYGFTPIE